MSDDAVSYLGQIFAICMLGITFSLVGVTWGLHTIARALRESRPRRDHH